VPRFETHRPARSPTVKITGLDQPCGVVCVALGRRSCLDGVDQPIAEERGRSGYWGRIVTGGTRGRPGGHVPIGYFIDFGFLTGDTEVIGGMATSASGACASQVGS